MSAQMYDLNYVAARLKARRAQLANPEKTTMTKRMNLTPEEMAELRQLVAGGADEMMLGAFGQRYNVHGSSLRSHIRTIRAQLAAVDAVAEAAVVSPPAVVLPPPTPPTPPAPAAPNGLTGAPPAARIGTIIDWLTTIRAMRDELREHGVLVEGTISIRVEL